MQTEITKDIWNKWLEKIYWILGKVVSEGGDVEGPILNTCVLKYQVDALTEKTGLHLPSDFIQFITDYAGGIRFSWQISSTIYENYRELFSKIPDSGGNSEVPFVGVTIYKPPLDLYNEFQNEFSGRWIFNSKYDDDADILETRKALPYCFPLYMFGGGGGNYTVLRTDTHPAQILYLDHEWAYSVTGRAIIGLGFSDFFTRWSNLGYPEIDRYCGFYNEKINALDDTNELAQKWFAFLNRSK